MNRPGGIWFHPGFAYQLESFELPISPPEGPFGPGPRSRPETQSFLRRMAVRRTARRDRCGQHPRLPEPRWQPAHRVPRRRVAGAGAAEARRTGDHRDPRRTRRRRCRRTCCPPRISSSGPTSRCGTSSARGSRPSTRPLWSPRSGQRRSMWWVLAEIGRRLGHELADTGATDEAMLARVCSGGRCPVRRARRERLGWKPVTNCPRHGWTGTSSGWAAGAWRPAYSSISSHALREPAPLVLVPRRQMRRLNAQLEFLGEPAESSSTPTTRPRRVSSTDQRS